jgi:hypothetical protein
MLGIVIGSGRGHCHDRVGNGAQQRVNDRIKALRSPAHRAADSSVPAAALLRGRPCPLTLKDAAALEERGTTSPRSARMSRNFRCGTGTDHQRPRAGTSSGYLGRNYKMNHGRMLTPQE